jgi:hypothetical protein
MTETEINEALLRLEQQRNELLPPAPARRTGACYRRQMRFSKNDRLVVIVGRHYIPRAGYIDWGFDGKTLLHSGKYIKYPKNSNCQKWMKRETSRRIRNCECAPPKGNFYRRLFDYWWTMY